MLALYIALQIVTLFTVYKFSKTQLSHSRLARFVGILLIGFTSTLSCVGGLGAVLGAPSIVISAILVSLLLDKGE